MKPQNVKPGDSLTIPVYDGSKDRGHHLLGYDDFIVEKVYPNHVLAYDGKFYECFTFGELVQMGLEDGHNKSLGCGSTGQAWRLYKKGKDQIEEENHDSDYH